MPFFDDEGNEIDPSTIPMPSLCDRCGNQDDENEYILCTLNRMDQVGENQFRCGAFVSRYGALDDVIIE